MACLGEPPDSHEEAPTIKQLACGCLALLIISLVICGFVAICVKDGRRDEREDRVQKARLDALRRQRKAEREKHDLDALRRRIRAAQPLEGVAEERYLGSTVDGGNVEKSGGIDCCVLVLRTDQGGRIALYIETHGGVRAMSVYALAKEGIRVRFPAHNVINAENWPPQTYGTFFERGTWTGTKGADQIEFIEQENTKDEVQGIGRLLEGR